MRHDDVPNFAHFDVFKEWLEPLPVMVQATPHVLNRIIRDTPVSLTIML
jgi:hypothetical protein